jgi:2-polyprenyl-3-methyl-5-hydroxy-6-metoxy-1,4-benzoquinol methylase
MSKIADNLVALYAPFGLWRRFYVRFRVNLSRFDQVEKFLPRAGRVLDLGCGFGVMANYLALAEPARQVIGMDLNARRIAIAQTTVGARANIQFIAANVMDTNLPPCDAVMMTDVLHHLEYEQQAQLFGRIRQLLAPNGVLLIQEVNTRPRWKYLMSLLSDILLYWADGLPNFRSERDWVTLLEQHQFRNVRVLRGDSRTIFARVSYVATV